MSDDRQFVTRAGHKLDDALSAFGVDVRGLVCADLGSNVGGFVDCLLQHGAARVFAVERGYGVLDYRLRRDPRVVVMERTDALTVRLPGPVGLVTIDCGWTRQGLALAAGRRLLTAAAAGPARDTPSPGATAAAPPGATAAAPPGATAAAPPGIIISLVKPHYEADPALLRGGVLPTERVEPTLVPIRAQLPDLGLRLVSERRSPLAGRAGNTEVLWLLVPE